MKKAKIMLFIFLASLAFVFPHAQADENAGIELNMIVAEEVEVLDKQGEKVTRLVEPASIVPGDKVVYTTEYHNKGSQTVNRVTITNPVPKDLAYLEGSAEQSGVPVTFSINDGKSFNAANKLIIEDKDGKSRPATAKDYTHIRWTLDSVTPGGKGTVRFSARLK